MVNTDDGDDNVNKKNDHKRNRKLIAFPMSQTFFFFLLVMGSHSVAKASGQWHDHSSQ